MPVNEPDVIRSVVNPDYDCVRMSEGVATPPGPPAAEEDPSLERLCPDGYVPRRRRRPYVLEGMEIRTGEPPTRNPGSRLSGCARPPEPGAGTANGPSVPRWVPRAGEQQWPGSQRDHDRRAEDDPRRPEMAFGTGEPPYRDGHRVEDEEQVGDAKEVGSGSGPVVTSVGALVHSLTPRVVSCPCLLILYPNSGSLRT